MPSSILNSDDGVISGTSGIKAVGGDDGVLVFQSKGTETARINTDKQIVAAAGTASLPIYSTTGDVNTGIYFPAADNIGFATNGVIRGRWTTDGLCFGSDTAAANALDDYEEGTWTGTLKGSVSDPSTPVTATGNYVKIGKQVTLSITYDNVNTTGGSGNVYISGIPFNAATRGGGSVISYNFNFSAGQTSLASNINTSLNIITLFTSGTAAAFGELQYGAGATRYLYVDVTYFV